MISDKQIFEYLGKLAYNLSKALGYNHASEVNKLLIRQNFYYQRICTVYRVLDSQLNGRDRKNIYNSYALIKKIEAELEGMGWNGIKFSGDGV